MDKMIVPAGIVLISDVSNQVLNGMTENYSS